MDLEFAIGRLTADIKKREWDSGFIWIHGQSDPVPINKTVVVRHIRENGCLECIVKDVTDPFDPGWEAHMTQQGPVEAREGGRVNGWTYIAIDAINRIDLFQRQERQPEKKIIAPPAGMSIIK